ncbi:MAG: enoyl-CoA hydratase/isomerase family protein [Burkholderiaceae bacterium]
MTDATTDAAVLLERHEGWAEIVLNRPRQRNAIDGALADALLAALRQVQADDSLRAVVLRGAGGAFCAGLDLKAFGATPVPDWVAGFAAHWRTVHVALASLRVVLIVALERFAINGGAALALAGDLSVCGAGAFLQIGEARLGMAAPNNLAWLRMRHSEAVAARLMLSGERVGAEELLRLGVVSELCADDAVLARCRERAVDIAGWPADALARTKLALRAASLGTTPEAWFAAFAAPQPGFERLRT